MSHLISYHGNVLKSTCNEGFCLFSDFSDKSTDDKQILIRRLQLGDYRMAIPFHDNRGEAHVDRKDESVKSCPCFCCKGRTHMEVTNEQLVHRQGAGAKGRYTRSPYNTSE
ncbi:hypothetical protein V6N13_025039 [Hibiscus sabdariffa]|uniref:Uncharacterized protein n=2 Tax=Hibiscus sabdariffa TaxID=183260 RepID=A0ABR2BB60_9ROSI